MKKLLAKTSLTGAAAIMALATAVSVPTFAAAQSSSDYYGRNNYSYDPCRRDTTSRSTGGGIIGALAGAAIGSNVAGRNVRKEGAVLGALAGAALGANIGKRSAACESGQSSSAYYNDGQSDYGSYDRGQGYYGGNTYGSNYDNRRSYNSGYDNRSRSRSRYDAYATDDYGDSYRVNQGQVDANGCSLAESPIYLPDGRVQKRFVRVCRDSSGRYQVVD